MLWVERAELLVRASRIDDAWVVVGELWQSDRAGDPRARQVRAAVLLARGADREALEIAQGLPLDASWRIHAKAAAAAGLAREARTVVAAALLRDPWLDEAYLELGRVLARAGDPLSRVFLERYRQDEAYRRALEQAVEAEFAGQAALGKLLRARAEWDRGRLHEHMRLANEALRIEIGLGDAYLELARLSLFLERPWDAIEAIEKLPRVARTSLTLGHAYAAAGDTERARELYRDASSADETRAAARAGLERLDRASTDLDRVRESVRDRVRDRPLSECSEELWTVVEAYARHKKNEEARRLALFLVHLEPRGDEPRLRTAELLDEPGLVFLQLALLLEVPRATRAVDESLERMGISPAVARKAALQGSFPADLLEGVR